MPLSSDVAERERRIARLREIKADLAISGGQTSAWDELVDMFHSTADLLEAAAKEMACNYAERPPSFPDALELRMQNLMVHLATTRRLSASLRSLYRSLTPSQRMRADRLLPTLYAECGWLGRPTETQPRGSTRAGANLKIDGRERSPLAA